MTERVEVTASAEVRFDSDDGEEDVDTSYLDDVEDGCGCAEVWEHLSEERDE